MLHLFLVYPNTVTIFQIYQEDKAAHYILGKNHIDFLKEFDFGICIFDHTYIFHKLLKNYEICLLGDNCQH